MEEILNRASKVAEEAEVFMVSSEETPVEFETNRLKHIQTKQSTVIALRIIKDGKIGYATTTRTDDIEGLVANAVATSEFGTNALDGSWVIEGYGVDPDIVVENDATSILAGRDPQLERGVEEVMKRIRENPKKLPDRPADPVKTK